MTSLRRSGTETPIRRTPLVPVGPRTFYKLENLQLTGSFKVRGAWRKLSTLSPQQRSRGVVTASAGNHGAGLALAAARLEVPLRVFVPEGTPEVKKRRITRFGAALETVGNGYDAASSAAREECSATGALYISAYDDDDIIAGNGGSLAREIVEQLPGIRRVVAPVGGGGMIAGLAIELCPGGVEVVGAQPERNCAMYESMQRGRALVEYDGRPTVAEGCEGAVAERTYSIVSAHELPFVLVSEESIERAVARTFRNHGHVIECSAAVAVAANEHLPDVDGPTVVIVSGGNIDDAVLDDILARH